MNDQQVLRYGRQILLDAVGGRGQRALLAATVVVELVEEVETRRAAWIALLYLAGAGVGTLVVRDEDGARVSAADVGMLFERGDVGELRFEALRQQLAARNPDVQVTREGDGVKLEIAAAPAGVEDAASRALWRGSAAATGAIAAILSANRTPRA